MGETGNSSSGGGVPPCIIEEKLREAGGGCRLRNPPRRLSLVDFENQQRDETNQREQSGPRADHSSARRVERAWRVILLGARAGCLCSVETPKMRLDPERPVER